MRRVMVVLENVVGILVLLACLLLLLAACKTQVETRHCKDGTVVRGTHVNDRSCDKRGGLR